MPRYFYRPRHPKASANGFVSDADLEEEVVDEQWALHANCITDRLHEGTRSPVDNTDIGSRRKRREYLKATGLVDATDFTQTWAKQKAEREAPPKRDPALRHQIGKIAYELEKKHRRR